MSELRREAEVTRVEINDLKTVNSTLKSKLSEAQESLKSNENLITYLNKQLNDKPSSGLTTGLMSGQSTQSSFGAKLGGTTGSAKPPTPGFIGSGGTQTFKPSFSSIEQLQSSQGGPSLQSSRANTMRQSFERLPSPSYQVSRVASSPQENNKENSTPASQIGAAAGNRPQTQFVSKYTQMLLKQ